MPQKFTHEEFLIRLQERNANHAPVFLTSKNQYYDGQNKKLEFKCEQNHTWNARPGNVLMGQGCPTCKLKNDSIKKRKNINKVIEEFKYIHGEKYNYDKVVYVNNKTNVIITCPIHGDFEQTPISHKSGHGCPVCALEKSRKTKELFVKQAIEVHGEKYDYSKVDYINAYTQVDIICPVHGEFKQMPYIHLQNHGCPACANVSISYKQISWLKHIEKTYGIYIQHALNKGEYRIPELGYRVDGYCAESNTVYEFHGDAFHGNINVYDENEFCHPFKKDITARELYEKTIKKEKQIKDNGYNLVIIWEHDFDKMNIPVYKFDYDSVVHVDHSTPEELLHKMCISLEDDEFKGFKHKHNYKCLLCGKVFVSTLSQRKQTFIKRNSLGCPDCSRHKRSDFSLSVQKTLQNIGLHSYVNSDKIICIDETDIGIYICDFINGVEGVNGKYFNRNLIEKYKERGRRVLIFYQDEWLNKKELLINKILHIIHKSDAKRIYARQCQIREIDDKKIKSDFLKKYHIQGNDHSDIWLGAYYNDNLISVMTFAKPRISLGAKRLLNDNIVELVRFATDSSYHVVGIASKLFSYYRKTFPNLNVYSFADRRWSEGNLYEKLGFVKEKINAPDYYYIVNGERKHRWSYRKDVLKNKLDNYDFNLTEYENMKNHGYDRIWGCGTIRYMKNISETT